MHLLVPSYSHFVFWHARILPLQVVTHPSHQAALHLLCLLHTGGLCCTVILHPHQPKLEHAPHYSTNCGVSLLKQAHCWSALVHVGGHKK